MPWEVILVAVVIFFGVLTQSLTGFGSGLVTMAFLPAMMGIRLAAPLVALMNLLVESVMLVRYRKSLQFKTVLPMIIASLVMIPLGVWAVSNLDEKIVLRVLGSVMIIYSIWALSGVNLPQLNSPAWKLLAGGTGGMLGGAFNTSGPPVIMYGNCRRWAPDTFKANLTGYFILNSLFIVANHAWSGNLSADVWRYWLAALPAIVLGMLAGFRLDRIIPAAVFRKIVLVILLVMGMRFLF